MKTRDVDFFRPLWRRVAVMVVCVVWLLLEIWGKDPTWIVITAGLSAYAMWTFFLKFPKDEPAITEERESDVPPAA